MAEGASGPAVSVAPAEFNAASNSEKQEAHEAPATVEMEEKGVGPMQDVTEPSSTASNKETLPFTEPVPAGTEPATLSQLPGEQKHTGPAFPDLPAHHPLSKLLERLPTILSRANYAEVYGVDISDPQSGYTKNILQKFLRANANDITKAEEQLLATLQWRKEFQPLKALEEAHSKEKFGGLGYVTVLKGAGEEQTVVTWNIYGAVKDNKATFGDLDSFLRWRVALMELSLSKLGLSAPNARAIPDHAATPTPSSRDPYQLVQVHDYLNLSFLRQDPLVKAASRRTIDTFSRYYPETLSRKFFVNVPVVMGWVFAAFKLILPRETLRKFEVLSYGSEVAAKLGDGVPRAYGGTAEELAVVGEQTVLA